jgi:RimJ/RimL family protein N-acetyltransferase
MNAALGGNVLKADISLGATLLVWSLSHRLGLIDAARLRGRHRANYGEHDIRPDVDQVRQEQRRQYDKGHEAEEQGWRFHDCSLWRSDVAGITGFRPLYDSRYVDVHRRKPIDIAATETLHVSEKHAQTWSASDGTVITIRPISAADLALEQEFVNGLSADTSYLRLMSGRRLSLDELKRFTDIDHERELALIATTTVQGKERQIGVARYVKDGSSGDAELAIVLSDDWQKRGLGTRLLVSLLAAAKSRGVRRLVATTLSANSAMLALARKLGFKLAADPRSAMVTNLTLDLCASL